MEGHTTTVNLLRRGTITVVRAHHYRRLLKATLQSQSSYEAEAEVNVAPGEQLYRWWQGVVILYIP